MKLITWNMAHRGEAWRYLLDSDVDLALLQEAAAPPLDVAPSIETDSAPWETAGAGTSRQWRTAVANVSGQYELKWIKSKSIEAANYGEFAVSRSGTLAAATVTLPTGEELTVISIYGVWERPDKATGSGWIYADASVHRVISDLSFFIGQQTKHRMIVAGDLNVLFGYGEKGSQYWAARYQTVFDRLSAIGLKFVGPQAPHGRLADPWPEYELPHTSKNIPTFHTNSQTPVTATRQLDFVFASSSLCDRVRVTALNDPEHWGPSDHCIVEIEIN
jgi:endonuclease/exonuclease/phosphatase family metal-dependent hydrolase